MATADATYDILIAIRDKLDGLNKAQRGMKNLGGGVDEVNAKSSRLGETFKAVFGANLAERALSGIVDAAKAAALAQFSLAGEVRDAAQNLEMSARGYQVYSQIVRDAGGDVGSLRMGISKLNQSLVEARDVSSGASAAFERLGLNPAALEAMDAEHRIEALAIAVNNSEDRLGAFSALGKILGERTLPQLRGALKDVAENGYDVLAKKMENANRILSDGEIAQLDDVAKGVERTKLQATVLTARATAGSLGVANGAKSLDPLAARPTVDQVQRLRDATTEVLKLRTALEDAARAQALLEGDPAKGEQAKRSGSHAFAVAQADRIRALYELRNNLALQPLGPDESMAARAKEIDELKDKLGEYINLRRRALGAAPDPLDELKFRAVNQNSRLVNPQALDIASGAQAGALQWLESIGSKGEQVAAVVQGNLGGAIDAVSAKLAGGDVRSWGEVWRGVLQALLQDLIKVALQMQVMQALVGIFGGAPAAGGGSIPSLGSGTGYTPLAGATATFSVPGRASGGDVEAGRMYNVNEKGYPEVFIPRVSGRISPSAMSLGGEGKGRGGASIVVQQTINVSTGVQETVRAEIVGMLPALRSSSVDALRDAIARNEIQVG